VALNHLIAVDSKYEYAKKNDDDFNQVNLICLSSFPFYKYEYEYEMTYEVVSLYQDNL
jgi:hypothetical protein